MPTLIATNGPATLEPVPLASDDGVKIGMLFTFESNGERLPVLCPRCTLRAGAPVQRDLCLLRDPDEPNVFCHCQECGGTYQLVNPDCLPPIGKA